MTRDIYIHIYTHTRSPPPPKKTPKVTHPEPLGDEAGLRHAHVLAAQPVDAAAEEHEREGLGGGADGEEELCGFRGVLGG